uniref:Uncharacterized protein n=1 Tax=Odontella aurita TaxID=265563 RepID=A0A7S4JEX7_9STRA
MVRSCCHASIWATQCMIFKPITNSRKFTMTHNCWIDLEAQYHRHDSTFFCVNGNCRHIHHMCLDLENNPKEICRFHQEKFPNQSKNALQVRSYAVLIVQSNLCCHCHHMMLAMMAESSAMSGIDRHICEHWCALFMLKTLQKHDRTC